jgi:hypothetical protein
MGFFDRLWVVAIPRFRPVARLLDTVIRLSVRDIYVFRVDFSMKILHFGITHFNWPQASGLWPLGASPA